MSAFTEISVIAGMIFNTLTMWFIITNNFKLRERIDELYGIVRCLENINYQQLRIKMCDISTSSTSSNLI